MRDLLKMKTYYDTIASIEYQIPEEDILYILAGLGIEYDYVVSVITFRVESHSLEDVRGLLLAQESRSEQHLVNSDGSQPSVNLIF
ncbi:hypothetical protein CK203_046133 [Vitis vinifera]|uniref:Uncharacterized protein n=1 Tax=Vitis vinifera TaxID=29760 RepID=A0A438I491_VITVI|nr:hypothetical protein CK203_046133 [Vitis vinifera]